MRDQTRTSPACLSAERDRRWDLVRHEMRKRGLDVSRPVGLAGHVGFLHGERALPLLRSAATPKTTRLIFPARRRANLLCVHADVRRILEARARMGSGRTLQDAVRGPTRSSLRLQQLGLERSPASAWTVLRGRLIRTGGRLTASFERMKGSAPAERARSSTSTIFLEATRSIKSAEELAMLEQAAALGDKMLERCRERARPGTRESEVYASMMEAMLADGGEEPTLFLWACDRYPVPSSLPTADSAQNGAARPYHLRDPSQDRRLLHPCRAHLLPWRTGP